MPSGGTAAIKAPSKHRCVRVSVCQRIVLGRGGGLGGLGGLQQGPQNAVSGGPGTSYPRALLRPSRSASILGASSLKVGLVPG